MMTSQLRIEQETTVKIACGQLPVPLLGGGEALIDESDRPLVAGFRWRLLKAGKHRYARAWRDGKQYLMHRVLLGLAHGDPRVVDHKDRNGLNNARANLRVCSEAENVRNRVGNGSRTGYKGVSPCSRGYIAKIGADREYLGYFSNPHDAARAYNAAALRRFGQFALLNAVTARW